MAKRSVVDRLDLRTDFTEIYAHVVERVQAFDPEANDGPGEPGPVTALEFGFGFDQGGWVVLVFDTRPDAEPDGTWNDHIEGNDLERPLWTRAFNANARAAVTLVLPDGTELVVPPGGRDQFAAALGDLLKAVLLKAREDGVFADLPRAARCELGVEEQEGGYGWPAYEERGQDNVV